MGKTLRRIRAGGYFAKADLALFLIVLAVASALFASAFLFRSQPDLTDIRVFLDGELVYSYDVSRSRGAATGAGREAVSRLREDGREIVTVRSEKGYNVLEFDRTGCRALDSDCGPNRACVRLCGKIERGGETIVCAPHALRVVGYGNCGGEVLL